MEIAWLENSETQSNKHKLFSTVTQSRF